MVCPISAPRVIVVVEDEVLIRLAVLAALEEANFRVIEAGHAGEALAVLD
jgi:DNA-binding response OmpR family regulator